MGKDPAFLFYTSDFILGTWVMSFEDRGKYITLLSYMHQHGRITTDIAKAVVGEVPDILKAKFKTDENGMWYNERLEAEIHKRKKFVDSRTSNGIQGGRPVNSNNSTNDIEGLLKGNEKYPFETFWNMYDKKTDRMSCLLKWKALPEKDQNLILEKLPAYVAATPDKQYRKNPLTYLRRKGWQDEMPPMIYKEHKKSAIEILAETGMYPS